MNLKKQVAAAAVELVENNMVLGLGTGSTTKFFLNLLAEKIQRGYLKNIIGVPTSNGTATLATKLGIQLGDLADYVRLDMAVDGADEVDRNLNMLKGWGGALVREKLVEIYADRLVIVVDESKLVGRLGTRGPLPIEVTPFAWQSQANWLAETLACRVTRREDGTIPYITDNQNFILNCTFAAGITDPYRIRDCLGDRPGLVGHGLFLDMATDILVGTPEGVKVWQRS